MLLGFLEHFRQQRTDVRCPELHLFHHRFGAFHRDQSAAFSHQQMRVAASARVCAAYHVQERIHTRQFPRFGEIARVDFPGPAKRLNGNLGSGLVWN